MSSIGVNSLTLHVRKGNNEDASEAARLQGVG